MPYAAKHVAALLWTWGDAQRHGYWRGAPPADPDTPRLAAHFGSRLPCADTYLDIARAFAAIHPATASLGNTGGLSWYVHAPQISREQEAIYLYYVEGLGLATFRREFAALPQARKDAALAAWGNRESAHYDEQSGDNLVAARLGVHPTTAYRRRTRGIGRMVEYLNGPLSKERAA